MTMRTWLLLTAVAIVSGLLYWKNSFFFRAKPVWWRAVKSATECAIILLSAWKLPALLIGWAVLWLTGPIEHPGWRVSAAVVSGLAFGVMSAQALDVLVLISIFSIDLITGERGFLASWQKAQKNLSRPSDAYAAASGI